MEASSGGSSRFDQFPCDSFFVSSLPFFLLLSGNKRDKEEKESQKVKQYILRSFNKLEEIEALVSLV